ncbi:hypothetical protein [Streptomyces griseofuscus]|uniref:Uncharacterized protein n=1 Tax=Streptomyces griseofuscus TaxID=146922 RepID=A0A7H1Q303_9ACTN|nr:hypothetical protein [Streptomyces griseofuscus]QNT94683.1 hypothetical protein HEP81_04406 [Streptomyces griseofuscus]BBC95412.1 hypothetical protein SRO_4236 [Streptomyces rochei]
MNAYSGDLDLNVTDATGNGVEVDVATNLLNGTVRLSLLWTQEIYLHLDDAERVAKSLLRAATQCRQGGKARRSGFEGTSSPSP